MDQMVDFCRPGHIFVFSTGVIKDFQITGGSSGIHISISKELLMLNYSHVATEVHKPTFHEVP